MIPYERTRQQTIPNSAVKIIGVGGAGANMLDRIALDGMEGAEILACNTDVRTLTSSVAPEKIQLGRNLTKGLGTGGDPELGKQAAHEAELEIRDALRDRKIIFICVGLGGGTGSGAAPLVARLAREQGAFTVVFATTPFMFEGHRRREQAETALNELSVLANALITFDNTRMGELVLAKQGVHEAFSAADRMISESIRAVTRIVMRPGLVNIGLDDLMAALSSPKSRCLFGSGIAQGENRAQKALKNALVSPLLDRGSLLHDTLTVLVHVCGGEDLTLYELELLMRGLSKHVPDTAQILFGTSVDSAMGDSLSVTLVSSLPEERLRAGIDAKKSGTPPSMADLKDDSAPSMVDADDTPSEPEPPSEEGEADWRDESVSEDFAPAAEVIPEPEPEPEPVPEVAWPEPEEVIAVEPEETIEPEPVAVAVEEPPVEEPEPEPAPVPAVRPRKGRPKLRFGKSKRPGFEVVATKEEKGEPNDDTLSEEEPVKLPSLSGGSGLGATSHVKLPPKRVEPSAVEDVFESAKGTTLDDDMDLSLPPREPAGPRHDETESSLTEVVSPADDESESERLADFEAIEPSAGPAPVGIDSLEEIQASAKARRPQDELALDGGPKGKFSGEDPNLLEGEDLDIPPFLRKKK